MARADCSWNYAADRLMDKENGYGGADKDMKTTTGSCPRMVARVMRTSETEEFIAR